MSLASRASKLSNYWHSLLPQDLTIQNLFISTAADVVPCGGRKTFSYIVIEQIILSGPSGLFSSFRTILKIEFYFSRC